MAMIVCPECGANISDQAVQCIHCGYPIARVSQPSVLKIRVGELTGALTKVRILTTDGRELAAMYENSMQTIKIDKQITIYAKRTAHKESNRLTIYPNRTTRVQVGKTGMMGFTLTLNEIDVMDSD